MSLRDRQHDDDDDMSAVLKVCFRVYINACVCVCTRVYVCLFSVCMSATPVCLCVCVCVCTKQQPCYEDVLPQNSAEDIAGIGDRQV